MNSKVFKVIQGSVAQVFWKGYQNTLQDISSQDQTSNIS